MILLPLTSFVVPARSRDTRLHRIIAIKILPAHVASDAAARARFEREARAVAALNHPHICTLHDIGRERGIDFLFPTRIAGGPIPGANKQQYAVASDGQRFLVNVLAEVNAPITLILHW